MRYVEANPLKAKLVDRAQDWEWSSLAIAPGLWAKMLDPWPVDRKLAGAGEPADGWDGNPACARQPGTRTTARRRFLDQKAQR